MKGLPMGRRESETMEFKQAAALDRKETIARAAVGLLNGKRRGTIWVGVREENEVAVATEDLGGAVEDRRRALEDALGDLIEPPPTAEELSVVVVTCEGDRLLRINCCGRRRPYALRIPRGGRMFVIRRGATTRPMTREEIREAFCAVVREPLPAQSTNALVARRKRALAGAEPRFWLGLNPSVAGGTVGGVRLDVQGQEIRRLLTDPEASSNRRGPTWSVVSERLRPHLASGRIQIGADPSRVLELKSSGVLSFRAPLRILTDPRHPTRLYPLAVLEFPVSFARLAAKLFTLSKLPDDEPILLDLAIRGAHDWTLLPDTHRTFDFDLDPPQALEGGCLEGEPIMVRWADLRSEPDRTGMRLVSEVYRAFGYDRSRLPGEYDAGTGRLNL